MLGCVCIFIIFLFDLVMSCLEVPFWGEMWDANPVNNKKSSRRQYKCQFCEHIWVLRAVLHVYVRQWFQHWFWTGEVHMSKKQEPWNLFSCLDIKPTHEWESSALQSCWKREKHESEGDGVMHFSPSMSTALAFIMPDQYFCCALEDLAHINRDEWFDKDWTHCPIFFCPFLKLHKWWNANCPKLRTHCRHCQLHAGPYISICNW